MEVLEKKKEKMSFEYYFNEYYRKALGFVQNRINDIHTAEDITMDAFSSCYSNFDKFDPNKASFQTWLFTVLNNKLKNYYRDRKDNTEIDDNLPLETDFEDEILHANFVQYMRDNLYTALKNLNETQRQIIVYKYFKNKNAVEIAEIMGMSHANVRVQLSRALQKLKDYFDENNIRWE